MSELLKGNFKTKNTVEKKPEENKKDLKEELKKAALSSIGGSMVYVERTDLTWDGDSESK